MIKRIAALVLALILPAVLLYSCSGNKEPEVEAAFMYPIDEMPGCLDPTIADTLAERTVIANCMEGLVRMDSEGNIQPGVAQTVQISDDGKTYEFHLRTNAKWHVFSGEDSYFPPGFDNRITAHDFVFSLRRALDPEMDCPDAERFYAIQNAQAVHSGALSSDQLGVRAADDYTLVIELEKAADDFLSLLTLSAAMPCNEQFFNSTSGRYGLELELTLYNGPYYLSKWNQDGDTLIIRKNADYIGETQAASSGITLKADPDEESRYENLSDGTYDAAVLGAESTARIRERTKMTVQKTENIVWGLCVNTQDALLSNLNLRLALFSAVDLSQLTIPEQMAAPAYGVIPSSCRSGSSSYRDTAGQADGISYHADTARNYWNQAKAELKKDSVSLKLLCTKEYETLMKKLIQNCQSVFGIAVSIGLESVDQKDFDARLSSGDYQLAFAPVKAETASPADFLAQFRSGSGGNFFRYQSEIYDDLASQAMAGAGTAVLRRAESHLIQNGVMYPFYTQATSFVQAKNVSGIYTSAVDSTPVFIAAQRSK